LFNVIDYEEEKEETNLFNYSGFMDIFILAKIRGG